MDGQNRLTKYAGLESTRLGMRSVWAIARSRLNSSPRRSRKNFWPNYETANSQQLHSYPATRSQPEQRHLIIFHFILFYCLAEGFFGNARCTRRINDDFALNCRGLHSIITIIIKGKELRQQQKQQRQIANWQWQWHVQSRGAGPCPCPCPHALIMRAFLEDPHLSPQSSVPILPARSSLFLLVRHQFEIIATGATATGDGSCGTSS